MQQAIEFELNKDKRAYLEESCKNYADELVAKYNHLVFDNHCYMRMAYDDVVKDKWDKKVEKPFYKNATKLQLQKAVGNMILMLSEQEWVHYLNRKSLVYRGKLKIEKDESKNL